MNAIKQLAAVVLVMTAGAASLGADGGAAAVTKAQIDKAVAALADYDSGKSRRPLSELERIVRRCAGRAEPTRHLERRLLELLGSKATDECKLFVCQQLWVVGSDETAAAETLRKMLLDAKTSHPACYALGSSASPQAGKVLRDALGVARGKVLIGIVNQLGERRDERSVEALGGLVVGRDGAAAKSALAALGKIATPQAAQILARARMTDDAATRTAATEAYLQCARGLAGRGRRDDAVAIYRLLYAPREPRLCRRAALVGLIDAGGAQAVELVLETLRGHDRMLKATAIANLAALKGPQVTRRLAAELPKLAPPVQVLLLDALVDRGDAGAAGLVSAMAASPSAAVRCAAVRGLGKVGDASAVALLARAAAEGKSEQEKRAALVSLCRLRGGDVDAAIIRCMEAAPPAARPGLIQVLHDRGAVGAVGALLKQAASQAESVRKAAFRALARLAGPKDVPALVELLVSLPGDAGRSEAEKAVVLSCRKIAPDADRAEAVLAALRKVAGPSVKGSLLRVLRGIANEKALEALRAARTDADSQVRDAAVRALAAWPDARAAGDLLGVYRTAPEAAHRAVALRGLVRVLRLAGLAAPKDAIKSYGQAMSDARGAEEKRLLLAGLADVPHPAALRLAESCMADQAVKAEAALALVKIARAIAGSHRDEARAAMKKLARSPGNAAARKQAEAVLRQIDALGDYLVAWQVAGPYMEEGKGYSHLFDVAFPPERPEAKAVPWRPLPVGAKPGRPWMLDLAGALGAGEQRVAYVRTWIHCDKARRARIELGTDDGNKLWLNGRVVLANNVAGAAIPGTYKVNLALGAGWNLLLLKITQANGPWEFCARLAAPDGSKLDGVRTHSVRD